MTAGFIFGNIHRVYIMDKVLRKNVEFRPAKKDESGMIAKLFSIASDGVADYIWTKNAEPGQNIFEYGTIRYAGDDTPFSYKNTIIAESGGEILGMILSFPMLESKTDDSETEDSEIDPVLEPYMKLEQYGSLYICAMAVFEEYRGMGIGSKFLKIAEDKARGLGLSQLSLIVFEQNKGAHSLYNRNGFYEVMREPVVPHKLIHHTGDALLMVKDLD